MRFNKKYIAYGDSITYGANSFHPSNHYAYRLSEYFNAELYNKGIGAEKFCPELLRKEEPIQPDYVTVAYGTNEDGAESMEEFKRRCHQFLEILSQKFAKAKIYVISPLYRSDCEYEDYYIEFKERERFILETAKFYPNLIGLYGYDLVEQSQDYFSDRPLHPNDKGFESFANNLIKKIEVNGGK